MADELVGACVAASQTVAALEDLFGAMPPLLVEHLTNLAGHYERVARERPHHRDEFGQRARILRAAIRRVEAGYARA